MAKNINGVTYFKLVSKYKNDVTKNCGLVGEEIDGNFYFLRGYDIATVKYVGDNLILTRVNGEQLSVALSDKYTTVEFNEESGILTFQYPDGSSYEVDSLMLKRVAIDETLKGDGSIENPLGISEVERTGFYAPALKVVDLTSGGTLGKGECKGVRVVTKEISNEMGLLYPFDAIALINERLKAANSQWRVATKNDWDDLLNALEPCEEDRNHSGKTVGTYGMEASRAAKSSEGWVVTEEVGEDIVGLSIYPLGYGSARNAVLNDDDHDIEGVGKIAALWTDSLDPMGEGYAKRFDYDSSKVYQRCLDKASLLSIRLVKDYDYNNCEYVESVLGSNLSSVLVDSPFMEYKKVWSKNVGFTAAEFSGVTSESWSAISQTDKESYYVCEWNGTKWIKKEMSEGDTIVIVDHQASHCHEWRISEGVLIDTSVATDNDLTRLENEITELKNSIPTLIKEVLSVALNGTVGEIKITEQDGKFIIGFDDNAVFGNIE